MYGIVLCFYIYDTKTNGRTKEEVTSAVCKTGQVRIQGDQGEVSIDTNQRAAVPRVCYKYIPS